MTKKQKAIKKTQKPKRHRKQEFTYAVLDEVLASPTQPLPIEKRVFQISCMRTGLAAIESGHAPSKIHWRVCADAVNIMETLIMHNNGDWMDCDGDVVQVRDDGFLLADATAALAIAGARSLEGGQIRLTGPGITAMRTLLEEYEALLGALPARTIVKAHRITERRVFAILSGKTQLPHDVKVIDL